eukprot:g15451.t1
MEMRHMEPRDLDEVKRLHEQCFPVRYDMAFYENVVHGVITRGKGNVTEPLYTQVAVVPSPRSPTGGPDGAHASGCGGYGYGGGGGGGGDDDGGGQPPPPRRYSPHVVEAGGGGSCAPPGTAAGSAGGGGDVEGGGTGSTWSPRAGGDDGCDGGGNGACAIAAEGRGREVGESIVGLITCQVMPVDRCRDRDRLGLGRGGSAHSEVVYILTLGTEMRYRRQGIGRALLRRCVWLSRQEPSIGAVYLHVITTNPPAHRFYESEGFVQVCEITEYYCINGELYDCFLYALFVNGAQPPEEWGWGIQSLSRRLRSIISFFRRTLGQVPEEGKLAAAVVAAAGSSGSNGSTSSYQESAEEEPHQQLQQQHGGDPEQMELDEERPPPPSPPPPCGPSSGNCSPDRGRVPSAFAEAAAAAGAAAVAARRGGGQGSIGSPAAPVAAGAPAPASATGGVTLERCSGRGFACSAQRGVLHQGRGGAGARAGAHPTVSLWDAAASGVGAWSKGDGALRESKSPDGVDIIEVGSGVVDVPYPGDGDCDTGGAECWGGGLGQERV